MRVATSAGLSNRFVLFATPLCFLAVACSDGVAPTPADVDEYMGTLPTWGAFSPVLPDTNDIVAQGTESREIVDGTTYECTVSPYSITQTPDKIVTLDPDVNVLWLGALLQGSGYKDGIGSLTEWAVRERAPLRVSVDLLSTENSKMVEQPDLASVMQATGELISAAQASSHRGGSSVSFSQEKTHSVHQAAISLGISYRFVSAGVRAGLSAAASRRSNETTITAYFVQRMFTTSIVLPSTPRSFFSNEFTPARLQEEISLGHVGSSNPPVYVASIAYGRILMFSMTSTSREDSIRAAISAATAKDDSVGISAAYLNILNTSKISVATVGGEGKNAAALIRSGNIADYFNDDAALTSARPISYVVRNLGDNSIARVSETTEYNLRECTAIPTTGTLRIDVTPNDATVTVVGAGGYQPAPTLGDQMHTELAPGGYVVSATRSGYDTESVDTVTVVAGATTDVGLSLLPTVNPPTRAVYEIVPTSLTLANVLCTGESYPDIFYDFKVNGLTIASLAEADAVSIQQGAVENAGGTGTWRTVVDTVMVSGATAPRLLSFSGSVADDDGALNPNDVLGTLNWSHTAPSVPSTPQSKVFGINGCSVRFDYDIEKLADLP